MQYSGVNNLESMKSATLYNRSIQKFIKYGTDSKSIVLDFGAGEGQHCNPLVEAFEVEAFEIDESLRKHINTKIVHGSVVDINSKYDVVYSINVLEHIENDVECLDQLKRLLKDGGTLKIFVPARMELYGRMDELVGHYRRYSLVDLRAKLINAGFEIRRISYYDSIGYVATRIYNCTNRHGEIKGWHVALYDKLVFPISRILDMLTAGKFIGKNIVAEATKV